MALVNFPRIRIKKYPKGWVVETYKRRFLRRGKWTHIIGVSGIDSEPWYYYSYDIALREAVIEFKHEILIQELYED
jgi:hypothetical protein